MKKLFAILFLVAACLQSCVIYINDPHDPSNPPGGQPWWEDTDDDNDNSDQTTDTISVIIDNETDDNNDNPEPTTNPDTIPEIVPTSRYEVTNVNGVLTFSVYLGWSIGAMETSVMISDYPSEGGEIFFDIYTNNMSVSMYGFSKYATDFYVFSNEPPYSGYSSYSLDTQGLCKYKMIIKENDTGEERCCVGYWACNNGGSFYASFRLILYQSPK